MLTGDDLIHRDTFKIRLDEKLSLRFRDYMVYLFERMLYTEMPYLYDRPYRFDVLRRSPYMELMLHCMEEFESDILDKRLLLLFRWGRHLLY